MGSVGNSTINVPKLIDDGYSHSLKYKGGELKYSTIEGDSGKFIYIEDFNVNKSKRGQGIGTYLLEQIKRMSTKNNLPIKLVAFPESGSRSIEDLIKWYEKRGFTDYGGNKMMYKPKK